VDDIPANTQLFKNHLSSAGYEVIMAANGEQALNIVRDQKPDLILLDVMMPKMDGFQVCKILKSNDMTFYLPIIMVTALNEVEDKVKGIEAGADDFITKPLNKMELLARVKSLLRIKSLQDQLQEKIKQLEIAKERLSELAVTDGLTGMYNYRFFKEYLYREIRRASRFHLFISLVMLDIDYFKNYNDAHGHLAGDEILKTLAQLMVANVRSIDVAARYGGEEFVLVLPETNKNAARVVAEKIKELVAQHPFPLASSQPDEQITVSMGIATYPENGSTVEEMIHCADRRLYRAKTGGRNRVVDSD
jgi:diguanylate cyclase (GGDEF)-like protein